MYTSGEVRVVPVGFEVAFTLIYLYRIHLLVDVSKSPGHVLLFTHENKFMIIFKVLPPSSRNAVRVSGGFFPRGTDESSVWSLVGTCSQNEGCRKRGV